ncbi:MAG TPA: YsnF/AvaK domain-containing protein [Rubrobacteraceae bacterium]|nr:YsnF/AvaK domain-containing protein [Rubrobacteraceae bacterium]
MREQIREACMERDDERAGRRETGSKDLHGKEGLHGSSNENLRDEDELRVQRSEEELVAGTREREAGQVKVSKQVHTEREQLRVPKRREEVSVERVPVNEEGTGAEIGEDEISMPVVEEEVVVDKRPVVKEEIRVRKDVVQDEELVEEDVRREEVDIEDQTHRLEEGRSTEGRREGETAETPEQPGRQAGTEQTGKEDFIDKAKRKMQGR